MLRQYGTISDFGLTSASSAEPRIADYARSTRNPKSDVRKLTSGRRPSNLDPRLRSGSVYIAVLGTSLIVSLLGLSALALQRIQNRSLNTTTDLRQAQLNAESAIELGLLAMKQDANWRTTYTSGHWITNRGLTVGTCSLDGTDPVDGNLANNSTDPVIVTGIGDSGSAEQRVQVAVDPRVQPLSCLRSGVAVGDTVTLTNGSVLRSSGLISANSASATSAATSGIFGNVQYTSFTGSTSSGTMTQISSGQLPTMPTWSSLFDYYKTNGTQISYATLSGSLPPLATNGGVETAIGSDDWSSTGNGTQLSLATALSLPVLGSPRSGNYCLKVSNRANSSAAATYSIDHYVKPGQSYTISFYVYFQSLATRNYQVSIATQGVGMTEQSSAPVQKAVTGNHWVLFSSSTLVAPAWSGSLAAATVKISAYSDSSDFYLDDLTINEVASGRYIYQKVLGPTVNNLYASAPTNNAKGIYWIDCGLNKLTIERSRINGTLLVLNPGAGSCVCGPVNWSPYVAGYPALLVHADIASNANFAISTTNRALSETENSANYNPSGMPFDFGSSDPGVTATDNDVVPGFSDIYPSEIRGLVAVENNLTYQNNGLIRGGVIVGNDLTSSGGTLEVSFQPESLLNPPPGFTGTTTYVRRPTSAKKMVLP